jgi:pimeloyl-ACP methyl ester carboxylesterase
MKNYILKNKAACLYSFYKNCFCKDEKNNYRWFKNTLLKNYLNNMSTQKLTRSLDYLGKVEIHARDIKKIKNIRLVHGKEDKIAPIDEAAELANALPQARFICFDRAGHLPFLNKDFNKHLYEH